jgi:uncharacterized protein YegP (UPF0339 family)
MDGPKVVVQQGEDGSWYWHCQAANGEIVCHGEAHTRDTDALRAARSAAMNIRAAFAVAAIEYR